MLGYVGFLLLLFSPGLLLGFLLGFLGGKRLPEVLTLGFESSHAGVPLALPVLSRGGGGWRGAWGGVSAALYGRGAGCGLGEASP